MKRSVKTAALIAAVALLLCSCGAAAKGGSSADRDSSVLPANSGYENRFSALPGAPYAENATAADTALKDNDKSTSELPSVRDNTKVIHTAGFRLQTTEFDKTSALIEQMVSDFGGYLERAEVYNNSLYNSANFRSAEYTARVPAEKYRSFLSGVNENCHVVSFSQNAQDVGEQYFDTEQRLETLRNKHERLENLLKQAASMNDIIQLESALSDCEYEINRLQTTLNRYDSLIGFSTVTISLQEVERPDSGIDEQPGFFEKLGRSFSEGFARFTKGAENAALWLSGHISGLVILIVVIIVLVKVRPIKRLRRKAEKRSLPEQTDGQSDPQKK